MNSDAAFAARDETAVSPPMVPLSLVLGVTGHRPEMLAGERDRIEASLTEIFDDIVASVERLAAAHAAAVRAGRAALPSRLAVGGRRRPDRGAGGAGRGLLAWRDAAFHAPAICRGLCPRRGARRLSCLAGSRHIGARTARRPHRALDGLRDGRACHDRALRPAHRDLGRRAAARAGRHGGSRRNGPAPGHADPPRADRPRRAGALAMERARSARLHHAAEQRCRRNAV